MEPKRSVPSRCRSASTVSAPRLYTQSSNISSGPGSASACSTGCAASFCQARRAIEVMLDRPEASAHSHSDQQAKPSCSHRSDQRPRVTALPNHWWDISWAISRSDSHEPSRWLVPNSDMLAASSGISSSSSATTAV